MKAGRLCSTGIGLAPGLLGEALLLCGSFASASRTAEARSVVRFYDDYFREITHAPQLTADNEPALARQCLDVSEFSDLYQSPDPDFYAGIAEYDRLTNGLTTAQRIENGYRVVYDTAEALMKIEPTEHTEK